MKAVPFTSLLRQYHAETAPGGTRTPNPRFRSRRGRPASFRKPLPALYLQGGPVSSVFPVFGRSRPFRIQYTSNRQPGAMDVRGCRLDRPPAYTGRPTAPAGSSAASPSAARTRPAAYCPRRHGLRFERGKSMRLASWRALTPKLMLFHIKAYVNCHAAKPNLRQKASLVA